ncbi:MAG: ATP-binding protein [Candidatus Accumulibacter sp.]|jgi:predicted AAA+ superfamily ATPase|nr:ATP-binding protein [Accumulibacter sp.]
MHIKRETYLKKIRPFMGTDLVKVLTGIRRCGKSVMLELLRDELLEKGVPGERMISINFDDPQNYPLRDGARFHAYIASRVAQLGGERRSGEKVYLFFDEIQEVSAWETCVNGLRFLPDVDIYLTGSNANLLSGELATYLTGRYVRFEIHPFSFAEFSEMHRLLKGEKQIAEVFNDYIVFGGMPFLLNLGLRYAPSMQYLKDIYQSIVFKDILLRNNIRDVDLLRRIIAYIIENIGKTFSASAISKYIKSENRTVSTDTVLNHVRACEDAFLFQRLQRNDLQGKKLLTVNEKYYVVDHGLREAVCENNVKEIGIVFENMVYMELVRRGYSLTVGKVGDLEINFVAQRQNELAYIQVSYYCGARETMDCELASLGKIISNYPKYIISLDDFDLSQNGIKHLNIRDFLLGKELA